MALALLIAGCSDDETYLSPDEGILMGRGVNFKTSIAEPFTTRTTHRHDGSFNEGDIMTIYRQYSHDAGLTFDTNSEHETYRVYYYNTKYATGTSIALETDWKPKAGETGRDFNRDPAEFTQTDADSLTWENGKTVRFRAWSRSNLADVLVNGGKGNYYPDYCVSGWVTVSGPTLDIPLTLKHQGCRIGFVEKNGNELYKAEICTDWRDYKRLDNSTDDEHDTSSEYESGKTDEQAKKECDSVVAVYNRMCMPAGVDINTSLLRTLTKTKYESMADADFHTIHAMTEGIVKFETLDSAHIRSDAQRPVFTSNIDSRLYMITIPYDISTEGQGEALTLPACTRIRIYLYDVNNGDKDNTTGYEATYHIFTLGDIMKNDKVLFPNGLPLLSGYSYLFSVGYHYDHLTVTPADNFSWEAQDAAVGTTTDEKKTPGESTKFAWWKNAIKIEIDSISKDNSQRYNPAFHIDTEEEFLELIELVNGTCVNDSARNDSLTLVLDPTKEYTKDDPATKADYRWYPSKYVTDGKVQNQHKADSMSHETAEGFGYIFYEHYYPANADQPAYSIEDYLRGPYSFFDENLNRHFTIYLDDDLDLADWELETIGKTTTNSFRGLLEGQSHTIKNINMKDEYMFGYCYDVSLMNLNIETTHNFKLIREARAANTTTGYGADFVGISLKAPSTGNPFATTLEGSSYVVGCYYEGKAGGALVGTADNLYMYGNMVVATDIPSGKGALLDSYAGSSEFFKPQTAGSLSWGNFMVNYYDITESPNATAVGGKDYSYEPQQYIRGSESCILKAKNDNLISDEVSWDQLTAQMKKGYYGLAPWKAMNYAIYRYNSTTVGSVAPCRVHYVCNTTGYDNRYPELVKGAPNSDLDTTGYKGKYSSLNVLKQNN